MSSPTEKKESEQSVSCIFTRLGAELRGGKSNDTFLYLRFNNFFFILILFIK